MPPASSSSWVALARWPTGTTPPTPAPARGSNSITAGTLTVTAVNAGTLDQGHVQQRRNVRSVAPAAVANLSAVRVVPGNRLVYTQTFNVVGTGDDLYFTIGSTAGAVTAASAGGCRRRARRADQRLGNHRVHGRRRSPAAPSSRRRPRPAPTRSARTPAPRRPSRSPGRSTSRSAPRRSTPPRPVPSRCRRVRSPSRRSRPRKPHAGSRRVTQTPGSSPRTPLSTSSLTDPMGPAMTTMRRANRHGRHVLEGGRRPSIRRVRVGLRVTPGRIAATAAAILLGVFAAAGTAAGSFAYLNATRPGRHGIHGHRRHQHADAAVRREPGRHSITLPDHRLEPDAPRRHRRPDGHRAQHRRHSAGGLDPL